MPDNDQDNTLIEEVSRSPKYAQLAPTLVSRVTREESKKYNNKQQIVRSARTRLHQLTGAYLPTKLIYAQWLDRFMCLGRNNRTGLEALSLSMMRLHASTAERLETLPVFFQQVLAPISPVSSILDLACGLNPLSIPWMPLADHFTYFAGDVVSPLVDFLQGYFEATGVNGFASLQDLSFAIPSEQVQLAMLMKTLPLMEQIERGLSQKILESLNAKHILVTYPLRSLGGRKKGMEETYRAQFDCLLAGKDWVVREFHFPNEIAYLVSK